MAWDAVLQKGNVFLDLAAFRKRQKLKKGVAFFFSSDWEGRRRDIPPPSLSFLGSGGKTRVDFSTADT
jgi:hypothetical protein